MSELKCFLECASEFADECRSVVARYAGPEARATLKLDNSLVTEADIEIERRLRARISELFPTHGIVGEEYGIEQPGAAYRWILDPIDGTDEFVHGVPTFGSLIALEHRGAPILGLIDHPALDIRVVGGNGHGVTCNGRSIVMERTGSLARPVRLGISKRSNFLRYGDDGWLFDRVVAHFPNIRVFDSCFAYSLVLLGGLDAMIDYNVRLWDIAAPHALTVEAGGRFDIVKELPRGDGQASYSVVFGQVDIVEEILHRFFSL